MTKIPINLNERDNLEKDGFVRDVGVTKVYSGYIGAGGYGSSLPPGWSARDLSDGYVQVVHNTGKELRVVLTANTGSAQNSTVGLQNGVGSFVVRPYVNGVGGGYGVYFLATE